MMRPFQNEPVNWERHRNGVWYLIEREFTDSAAAALAEIGLRPHVEYRDDMPTDVLWWEGLLSADQWEQVKKAHGLAGGQPR